MRGQDSGSDRFLGFIIDSCRISNNWSFCNSNCTHLNIEKKRKKQLKLYTPEFHWYKIYIMRQEPGFGQFMVPNRSSVTDIVYGKGDRIFFLLSLTGE